MPVKSAPPFVVRNDHIIHSATGQKLNYLRIVEKIATPTSLAVVVEFVDDVARRRKEELSWPEFRSWLKFSNKMMNFGYRCDNVRLLKLLHNWYMELYIIVKISDIPASGWWCQRGSGKPYYVRTNIIKTLSPTSRVLHKGSYAQRVQYGPDVSAADFAAWRREIAPLCGWSPALTVATLSPLAATLLPAISTLPSFCIFYGADEALDREVIRSIAACVFGAPDNFPILGKSPTPLQLVADFRHGVVCSDIPGLATKKQILSFFQPLLGMTGEISRVSLPSDMRLLALATGPHSHLDNVPQSIAVSGIVDPELRLYDRLPDLCTPEQVNLRILHYARQQKGGVGQKFADLVEKHQAKVFRLWVVRQINDFIEQLQSKTNAERHRAQAVALLWVAGLLGIKWQILPWKVERLESVLKQLFTLSCQGLPDPQALEEAAIGKLRQHIHEARKLTLSRRGHNLGFTAKQAKEAEIYLDGNYMYILPALFSQWLPGQKGEIAIHYLDKRSLLEKNLHGRRTKAVQKTILGIRDSYYGIDTSFLGEGLSTSPETVETGGGGDEVGGMATKKNDPGGAPVGGGKGTPDPTSIEKPDGRPPGESNLTAAAPIRQIASLLRARSLRS